MKKVVAIVLVGILLATMSGVALSAANSLQSSKATAKVSELTLIDWDPSAPEDPYFPGNADDITPPDIQSAQWQPILIQQIKTPNQKDLFIDVSLETGLYTRTLVKSKRSTEGDDGWDSSTAHAKIDVRVGVDGHYAEGPLNLQEPGVAFPRAVTFNEREQTLSAKFMGIFTGECFSVDPDTHAVTIDYECLEPEEIELLLNTLSANSFNFVVADLESGVHTISVEARISGNGAATDGSKYEAKALVGQGAVVIEEVRMIKGEDYMDMPE